MIVATGGGLTLQHSESVVEAADRLPLYFQGWEPGGQPKAVVCLVHGLGEHSGRYAHVGAALTEAGYALLAFDLRGHGRSGGTRGHTPAYDLLLDDVGHLLQEASARHPAVPRFLYGHSLGGNLALNYALRGCEQADAEPSPSLRGVVAAAPWLRLAFSPPGWKVALGQVMNRLWPAFLQPNGLDLQALSRDPAVISAYTGDPLVHDRVSARMGTTVMENGEWALAHAAECCLPLLLMYGSADRIISVRAGQEFSGRANGNCALKLWDGLYHEIHNEPEQRDVLDYMIRWIDEHRSGGA
jgi:alpha-beta hydrolase superfamily lysophospholipase